MASDEAPATTVAVHTADPDATRAVAAIVAMAIEPGDVVALGGELGAGKTCFVQGAARQLGVTERVVSPTFMLIRSYPDATPPIVHVDIYRLDRLRDIVDLGDEVFDAASVTFVEWGDAAASLLPDDRLDVDVLLVDPTDDHSLRRIMLTGHGTWAPRLAGIAERLSAWRGGDHDGRDGSEERS